METCPHCDKSLDPQRHRYRLTYDELANDSRLLKAPSERLERNFMVRCPQCANVYVSHALRRWGFLTYGRYVFIFVLVVVAMLAAALFAP